MDGIQYKENFLHTHGYLLHYLKHTVRWDESMKARKTASFGKAYNYSQINYPYQDLNGELAQLVVLLEEELGFKPNNCLINYYLNGNSRMGFHSDQTDILYAGTGVAIISLGSTRVLRFRNIDNKTIIHDFELKSGSLLYMSADIQNAWQHSIPKSSTDEARMSLTFRKLV